MRNLVIPLLILSQINKSSRLYMVFHIADCFGCPITQASVLVKRTHTNCRWFCGSDRLGIAKIGYIPPGDYDIVITVPNYETLNIHKKMCCSTFLEVCLDKKKSCIYGYIKDMNGCSINDATVVLYRVTCPKKYTAIRYTYSDYIGEYHFIDIPQGCYLIKSIK